RPHTPPDAPAHPSPAMPWVTTEYPTLVAAVHQAPDSGFDSHAWQLAWALAVFLDRQVLWHELAAIQQVALDAACRSANVPGQAAAHHMLGRADMLLGRLDDAHTRLRQALDLYGKLVEQATQA